jgi:hypothetical protein
MGRRVSIAATAAAGLLVAGSVAWGDPNWVGAPYSHTIPAHISAPGQSVSSSFDLTLFHDVNGCNVYFTAVGDSYLLKKDGVGASLTTEYKLTGASLDHQDSDWIAADQFARAANTYAVTGTGTSTIKLWVKASEPGGATPESAGNYSATLTVTVTWP